MFLPEVLPKHIIAAKKEAKKTIGKNLQTLKNKNGRNNYYYAFSKYKF
jgi:hypothetical protein